MKVLLKRVVQGIALIFVLPLVLACGLGRLGAVYIICAQCLALVPGIPGRFLRAAFYRLTLRECSIDTSIWFGSYFTSRETTVGPYVSIGSYSVIGWASIGQGTQIASHVEISGGDGQWATAGICEIGEHCWIGASAIVLAPVGARSTIGAGAVVTDAIPADSVAVGNPARVVRPAERELPKS